MNTVIIHTDGSCERNPGGPGGWAAIIDGANRIEIHGRCNEPTTNNRMELTAAIKALESLELCGRCDVWVYSDSMYLIEGARTWMKNWYRNNWTRKAKGGRDERKDVPNADLWKRLHELSLQHNIRWNWIKGHGKHTENNRADYLAGLKGNS